MTSTDATSDLVNAPPAFISDGARRNIFVDFLSAHYRLRFDAAKKSHAILSEIEFVNTETGFPCFSMFQPIKSLRLNGLHVSWQEKSIEDGVKVISVDKQLKAGVHSLSVESIIDSPGPGLDASGQQFIPLTWISNTDTLRCLLPFSDLVYDGGYLEAYVPSNYEYDHFRITMDVQISNSATPHVIFTNGVCNEIAHNEWRIEYPSFFTTSSVWFHLGPKTEYRLSEASFSSLDGRHVPVLVYSTIRQGQSELELEPFVERSIDSLREFETKFEVFPHNALLVFATGTGYGGMEYAGATTCGLSSLRHEINHSWFARNVMPINGNAGWIDEAIASWADEGYPTRQSLFPFESANIGNRSPYIRSTSMSSYSVGMRFLSHLNFLFESKGGLIPVLARYAQSCHHTSISAHAFQKLVEDAYGESLQTLFDAHVYSDYVQLLGDNIPEKKENPHKVSNSALFSKIFP